jgi:predicted porin
MNRLLLIALISLGLGHAAWGADDPSRNRFSVMVGGFWPDVDTTARANGTGGRVGTQLDFESDLGLDDRDALFTGGLTFRLAKRHYFDFLYLDLKRSGQRTIDIDINWQDQTFMRQAQLDTIFDTEVLRFSYGYAFIDDDRQRLMGQFGIHYTKVTAGLGAAGANVRRAEADTDVPLPVIGLAYDYAITPKVGLSLRAQIFRLEFEGIDGALDNLSANVQYAFTPRIAAFVGYNYYSIDVDASKEHWHGSFEFNYYGPWLGVMVGFGEPP